MCYLKRLKNGVTVFNLERVSVVRQINFAPPINFK